MGESYPAQKPDARAVSTGFGLSSCVSSADEIRTSAHCCFRLAPCARVDAGALWKQRHAGNDDAGKDCGRIESAECEASIIERFVQQISERGAQRPRQNKGGPEQQGSRYRTEEI